MLFSGQRPSMMSQKGTDIALCQLFGFQTYGRTNTALFFFIIRAPNLKSSQQALNSELKKYLFFYFVYIAKAKQNIKT